jgi:hypothetical protein
MGTTNTATFVLLLAQKHPLSFISGAEIDLREKLSRGNRAEFHHLVPKAYLAASGQTKPPANCFANFAFISRADNRDLGGVAPSKYRSKMPQDVTQILSRAMCNESLFNDDYEYFVRTRAKALQDFANELCI